MDNKKLIKQFIVEMSYWFEYKLRTERHTNFLYELKPSANLYLAGELRITYRPDPLDFKLRMEEDHKYTSL